MKLSALPLFVLLATFAASVHADDFQSERSHLFPKQVMFEVSMPFGGTKANTLELSVNFNNFENLATRSVIASFNKQGEVELPQFNAFGEEAIDWAKSHPYWAAGIGYVVIFGIPNIF